MNNSIEQLMKTKFNLDYSLGVENATAQIIGLKPERKPYVSIEITRLGLTTSVFVNDKDLELFAVNILKALKSKKLKP